MSSESLAANNNDYQHDPQQVYPQLSTHAAIRRWSCELCRSRKKKCDGTWPTCEYCLKRGLADKCVYLGTKDKLSHVPRKKRKSSKTKASSVKTDTDDELQQSLPSKPGHSQPMEITPPVELRRLTSNSTSQLSLLAMLAPQHPPTPSTMPFSAPPSVREAAKTPPSTGFEPLLHQLTFGPSVISSLFADTVGSDALLFNSVSAINMFTRQGGRPGEESLLIENYFNLKQPIEFLHKRTFIMNLANVNPFLRMSVLAAGAMNPLSAGFDKSAVFWYYERARALQGEYMDYPSIEVLQALLILGSIAMYLGHKNTAFDNLNVTYRMAIHLKLNQEPPSYLSWVEKETRRRFWWSCYMYDSIISAKWQRPRTLPSSNEIGPVCPDELWCSAESPTVMESIVMSTNMAHPITYIISLLDIFGEIYPRSALPSDLARAYDSMDALSVAEDERQYKMLLDWHDQLPTKYRVVLTLGWVYQEVHGSGNQSSSSASVALFLMYHSCVAMLMRRRTIMHLLHMLIPKSHSSHSHTCPAQNIPESLNGMLETQHWDLLKSAKHPQDSETGRKALEIGLASAQAIGQICSLILQTHMPVNRMHSLTKMFAYQGGITLVLVSSMARLLDEVSAYHETNQCPTSMGFAGPTKVGKWKDLPAFRDPVNRTRMNTLLADMITFYRRLGTTWPPGQVVAEFFEKLSTRDWKLTDFTAIDHANIVNPHVSVPPEDSSHLSKPPKAVNIHYKDVLATLHLARVVACSHRGGAQTTNILQFECQPGPLNFQNFSEYGQLSRATNRLPGNPNDMNGAMGSFAGMNLGEMNNINNYAGFFDGGNPMASLEWLLNILDK